MCLSVCLCVQQKCTTLEKSALKRQTSTSRRLVFEKKERNERGEDESCKSTTDKPKNFKKKVTKTKQQHATIIFFLEPRSSFHF